jgi:hypothetical protein
MDASESRLTTIGLGCFAAASVAFFAAVYAPALSSLPPGSGVRPWSVLLLLAAFLGMSGWLPCVVMGVRQLFVRPRRYGLYTIGFGAVQLVGYRLTEWLLIGSRGMYWTP